MVATVCWAIWNDRNKIVHGEEVPPTNVRSQWISDYLMKFLNANAKSSSHVHPSSRSSVSSSFACWLRPSNNFWKVNVDATWVSSRSSTSIGVVCKDSNGFVKGACASFF